jgi:hypothetical protein
MVALKSDPAKSLSDRVLALLERVNYRRADTAEEREAIFRLRYEAYLSEGAIPGRAPSLLPARVRPPARLRAPSLSFT